MKNISILVPESAVLQAICDPQYMFTAVNNFLMTAGKPALFDVKLVGEKKEVKLTNGHFSVHPDLLLDEVEHTDLIFIPALFGDMNLALQKNRNLLPWIVEHYHKGAEVASLCVGAFLLASTGLLEGKKCSTHWLMGNEFRRMFPGVELVDGRIITEEERIYSSGGANSYWNLLLYLVEKYTDRATAILAAKFFAIDIGRSSQSTFAIFQGQKAHTDEEIRLVQQHIEENFTEKFTIDELADMVALGRRSFERRFKAATNNTVVEYIQRVKIEAAKRSLELERKNVSEVMFEVGYGDAKAFRDVFRKLTGVTPGAYRGRYSRQSL
ncbi:MAG: helix-turn-helix domain-containing protein [Saprospiraceae bacterium]